MLLCEAVCEMRFVVVDVVVGSAVVIRGSRWRSEERFMQQLT